MSHTYKEGPPGRANGGAAEDARKDKVEDPPISLLEEDKDKTWLGGSRPRHLITFHTCIWRELTSNSINRASPPPLNTHTHTHHFTHPLPLLLSCLGSGARLVFS